MKKSLLLLGASCLVLFGCGNNDNDTSMQNDETKNPTMQQESSTQKENQGTFRYIESDEGLTGYSMKEYEYDPKSSKTKYEQVFERVIPDAKINGITENKDKTITIDFDPTYLSSENLTSSAQLNVFMDKIRYAMKENFPDVKGYYFNANGKPASFSNYGEVKDVVPNDFDYNNLYLPLNEQTNMNK